MSIVEPAEEISAQSAEETRPSAAKPDGSRRRRLNHDEEREIARLYGQTGTPTSEIRARFGIGDSSLYRVVQRQGVALRGRTASSPQPNASRTQAPAERPRRSSNAGGASPAVSPPRSRAATSEIPASPRVDRRSSRSAAWRASANQATTPAKRAASRTGGSARQRFQIRFEGQSVFDATDILDALHQAESLGAVEILAVSRED